MITLRCHCGRRVADWTPPLGGDGGQVTVGCKRCGPTCLVCQGQPTFALRGPILVQPPEGLRAVWRVLTGRAG